MQTTREQQVMETTPDGDAPPAEQQLGSFAGEFRPLARQQRFRRRKGSDDAPPAGGDIAAAAPEPAEHPPAPEPRSRPALRTVSAGDAPTSSFSRIRDVVDASRAGAAGGEAATAETYTMLVELSRMADRVIDSREQLVAERARAERAERDVRKMNERIMAARALVHEAQRTARIATDRCQYLEGRCESLEDALELAVNASVFTRWRWRREVSRRAAERAAADSAT